MNNTMSDNMNGNVNDKGSGNRKSAAPARVIAAGGVSLAHFTAARNTCKLCAPLGACFVYKGIEGCVPLLHGSQGCATYIRRYLISHFREPVDIASSSLTESSTVFGGQNDLAAALDNIIRQYSPAIIGIATTCLSETMGEDVAAWLAHYKKSAAGRPLPELIWASTPSYRGSHMQGFHAAVNGAVGHLARGGPKEKRINLFGGLFSCADIRHLHTVMRSYGSAYTIFPDYSETLDGPSWDRYVGIPAGGTPLADMAHMGRAAATIVFGDPGSESTAAAAYLKDSFGVDYFVCDYPIGMDNCNRFHVLLTAITGVDTAECFSGERGRLADAYIDAHKYLAGIRAVVCGEEDAVVALAAFLDETGVRVVAAASGEASPGFARRLSAGNRHSGTRPLVISSMDYSTLLESVRELDPDIIIGNSKAGYVARRLSIPLVRCGFPVHDRFGAQRLRQLGYAGTQELFDRIVNAVIRKKQHTGRIYYSYM